MVKWHILIHKMPWELGGDFAMEFKKPVKAFLRYLMSAAQRGDMGEKAISIIMAVGFIGIFGWIILYCMDIIQDSVGLTSASPFYNASTKITEAVELGFNLQTIIVVIMVFGVVIGGLYYMWNRGQNND